MSAQQEEPMSKFAQACMEAQKERNQKAYSMVPTTKVATVQFVQKGITADGMPVFVEEKVMIEERPITMVSSSTSTDSSSTSTTNTTQKAKLLDKAIPDVKGEVLKITAIVIVMAVVYACIWFLLDNTVLRTVLTLLSSFIGILISGGDYSLTICQDYMEKPIEKMELKQLHKIHKLVSVLLVRYTLKTAFFLPLAASSKLITISLPLSLSGIHQMEQCNELRETCRQKKELRESL